MAGDQFRCRNVNFAFQKESESIRNQILSRHLLLPLRIICFEFYVHQFDALESMSHLLLYPSWVAL